MGTLTGNAARRQRRIMANSARAAGKKKPRNHVGIDRVFRGQSQPGLGGPGLIPTREGCGNSAWLHVR